MIRLSFDDGPSKWTPQILDVLFEYDVQATFFVIGQHIAAHEETLERMVDEGHTVGNHTWSNGGKSGSSRCDITLTIQCCSV